MKRIYFLLIVFLIGCKDKTEGIYIGGQIENPISPYVLLSHKGRVVDTLYLDHQNKFGATYTDLEQGLYLFEHGRELQDLYLQKNDSLFIFLEAKEFDDSIVFTGRGFEKSEYFAKIPLFLKERQPFLSKIYALPPEDFIQKIDSIREVLYRKTTPIQNRVKNLSPDFYKVVSEILRFAVSAEKEKYPHIYQRIHYLDQLPKLPPDYYDFRKRIFTDQKEFFSSAACFLYILNFIQNTSTSAYGTEREYIVKFENVQKYIKNPGIRNRFLLAFLSHAMLFSNDLDKATLEKFLQYTTDIQIKKQVELFIKEGDYLKEREKILNFSLVDIQNNKIDLYDLIENKKAFIYFWNRNYYSEQALISAIQNLRQNYPNVQFVGVYMDEDIEKMNYSNPIIFEQYRLSEDETSQLHKQNKSSLHRNIIVDDKKNIIKSNIGFFASNLYNFLQDKD